MSFKQQEYNAKIIVLECSALQVCVVTGFGGDFEAMNQADEPHLKNLPGLDKTPPYSFIVSA